MQVVFFLDGYSRESYVRRTKCGGCAPEMKMRNQNGFSLVEIMAAMLLLIVVIMGSAAMIYQTGGGVQKGGNSRIAAEVVNEILELARSIGYKNLIDSSTNLTLNGITFSVQTDVVSTNHPDRDMAAIGMLDVVTRTTYDGYEISVRSSVFDDLGLIEE